MPSVLLVDRVGEVVVVRLVLLALSVPQDLEGGREGGRATTARRAAV